MALCPAIFDGRILPLYVTDLPQAFAERGHEVRPFGGGLAAEQSDQRHRWLLCAGCERPRRCRSTQKPDERASSHLISPGGNTAHRLVKPSTLQQGGEGGRAINRPQTLRPNVRFRSKRTSRR